MKDKKLFLKLDDDFSEIEVGLIRVVKPIPEHELFFYINLINTFNFKRIDDIIIKGEFFDYYFSRYEAYDQLTKSRYQFISNKSIFSVEKKIPDLLFSDELNIKYLLNNQHDVDYIITTSDMFTEFSLILLPENLLFHIQKQTLSSEEELYQLIQYYE